MADALGVNVGKRAEELVDVYLDLENGHSGLHLVKEAGGPVHSFRHELEDEVKVDFFFLGQASATFFMVPRVISQFDKILYCLHALHSSSRTL